MGGLAKTAQVYARECGRRLRANPRDPDALFARAAILAASGNRSEAIACLEALAKVASDYPGLWRFKARVHRDMGDERMAALCLATAGRAIVP